MKILEELKIKAKDKGLYLQALTHPSYANENDVASYERLEFLGDAVLELIISDYLFQTKRGDEGIMTKLRAKYVCEDALYKYGVALNINKNLLLGRGELESENNKAIVADAMEAFLGALFLDQGFDNTKKFFNKKIRPIIEEKCETFWEDYKTKFQELVQTDKRNLKYFLIDESGPAHDKKYTIAVKIDDVTYGIGKASSKKAAEQMAAKDALTKSVDN